MKDLLSTVRWGLTNGEWHLRVLAWTIVFSASVMFTAIGVFIYTKF